MTFDRPPATSPAFARAELLMLCGVLVIAFSIFIPAYFHARHGAELDVVRRDFTRIVLAMDHFFNEYNTWPSALMGTARDVRYGQARGNREIMNVLRAEEPAGKRGPELNPNHIVFLELDDGAPLSPEGDYLDPWGSQYQVVVDTDSDENCYVANSVYGLQRGQDLLVWSCGPDRKTDTADDLLAWSRQEQE